METIQFVRENLSSDQALFQAEYKISMEEGRQVLYNRYSYQDEEHEEIDELFSMIRNRLYDQMRVIPGVIVESAQLTAAITGELMDGQGFQMNVSLTPLVEFTGELIANRVSQYLNSAQGLSSSMKIVIVAIVPFRSIYGNVDRLTAFANHVRRTNRGIISVFPVSDGIVHTSTCLAQAILLALMMIWSLNREWERCEKLKKIIEREWTSALCNLVSRGRCMFEHRDVWAKRLAEKTGLQNYSSLKEIDTYCQIVWNVRLVMFELVEDDQKANYERCYPPDEEVPDTSSRQPIYLVRFLKESVDVHVKEYHVDYVRNPAGLFGTTRAVNWCDKCYQVIYRQAHLCEGICSLCNQRYITNAWIYCGDCAICKGTYCSEWCSKYHKCQGFSVDRQIRTDEFRCRFCKTTYTDQSLHTCFLPKLKLSEPSQDICVYDFECCLDENGCHVPYLATAWLIYEPVKSDKMMYLKSKYSFTETAQGVVFVFWGKLQQEGNKNVNQFFHFLIEPCFRNFCFWAHNARGYDNVFIKEYFARNFGFSSEDIRRGQKLLQMKYTLGKKYCLTFRDTLSFITSSLRRMGKDFGISELKKGYFPHKLMTTKFFEQVLEMTDGWYEWPSIDWFSFESRDEEARNWYSEQSKRYESELWNLKQDAIEYCISDTLLLGVVVKQFREECLFISSQSGYLFDPFTYVTLPAAMMRYYLSCFLPEKEIAIIYRFPIEIEKYIQEWFLTIEESEELHQLGMWIKWTNQLTQYDEYVGYIEELNLVLWFLDCYKHGCPKCNPNQGKQEVQSGETYGERFFRYVKILTRFRLQGYIVKQKRLCEWVEERKNLKRLKEKDCKRILFQRYPIDPREAYKGGKSEAFCFYYKGKFSMVDFVSQYPMSCLGKSISPFSGETVYWWLPTGNPVTKKGNDYEIPTENSICGIAKIDILPPRRLWSPFLGFKVDSLEVKNEEELLYGLCRTCMEKKEFRFCSHEENERIIWGTWTFTEIRYALQLGYEIKRIYEAWEYESSSCSLFHDFITPFVIAKICSKRSGLVSDTGEFTAHGEQTAEYLKTLGIKNPTAEMFVDNPGRRAMAKMCMNSVTGKLGEKEEQKSTCTIFDHEYSKLLELIQNPRYKVHSIQWFPKSQTQKQAFVIVDYWNIIGQSDQCSRKNDLLIAHITAYGRISLHKLENVLGKKLMYVDTDSAFFQENGNDDLPFETGFRIGDLEPELQDGKEWASSGRKEYVYETEKGKTVVKQKGVRLNEECLSMFTLHNRKQMVENIVEGHTSPVMETAVQQIRFRTIMFDGIPMKKTVSETKRIQVLRNRMKRVPIKKGEEISSVPFGWNE